MNLWRRSLLGSYPEWAWSYVLPTQQLAVFRIGFALHGLLLHLPAFEWAGTMPQAFFRPPTFGWTAALLNQPPPWFLLGVSAVLVGAYVCLLFGYRTRVASIVAALALMTGMTCYYSFGKIGHGLVFHLSTLTVLAFSPWGQTLSLDARRRPDRRDIAEPGWSHAWPVAVLALLIGFGYFSAGLPKARVWLDFNLSTHGARSWLIGGLAGQERVQLLSQAVARIESRWFWEVVDWMAVGFECSVLLGAALGRRPFRWLLVVALFFHAANYLVLNIDFTGLVAIYVLFFLPDLPALRPRTADTIERLLQHRWAFAGTLAFFLAAHVALRSFDALLPLSSGILAALAFPYDLVPRHTFAVLHLGAAALLLGAWRHHSRSGSSSNPTVIDQNVRPR